MLLAVISDVVWQALIAAVLALGLAWIGYKVQTISKSTDAVHTLVNSNMGAQLKLGAELSRWKAVQTRNKQDVAAADEAERLWRDHEAKQAMVDSREGKS